MYSSNKSLNKSQKSAFCPNYYAATSETQNFGRFQPDKQDFEHLNKYNKLNQNNNCQKQSSNEPQNSIEKNKSSIFSLKSNHLNQTQNSINPSTTTSMRSLTTRYDNNFIKEFKNFTKKTTTSSENLPFSKFIQMAKKQKQRFIPTFSLMFSPKTYPYQQKVYPCIVEELRQTQDTITGSYQFYTKNSPKASDFHQVKLLGKGKNGEVYLAIHKATGFACAMKIIKKSDINKGSPEERQIIQNQLLRQIKLQLYMSDPNLVELYAVFSDKDHIYLIQQLGIDGQLYDLMRRKFRFSEESTALLSRQILKGIKYMHSKHIIHRDIKPQNIVLTYGVAKLCDFGWSVYCPLKLRSTLCGTPLYLSPQALIGDQYNQKIDIWAYGTLVYELFTGDNPFQIKNRSDLKKIVTDELDFANNFPRRLRSFLESILKKKSSQRPAAVVIQAHAFLKKYAELQTSQELANL